MRLLDASESLQITESNYLINNDMDPVINKHEMLNGPL